MPCFDISESFRVVQPIKSFTDYEGANWSNVRETNLLNMAVIRCQVGIHDVSQVLRWCNRLDGFTQKSQLQVCHPLKQLTGVSNKKNLPWSWLKAWANIAVMVSIKTRAWVSSNADFSNQLSLTKLTRHARVNVTNMLRMCFTSHSLLAEACNLFPLNVLYGLFFVHKLYSLGMHATINCEADPCVRTSLAFKWYFKKQNQSARSFTGVALVK